MQAIRKAELVATKRKALLERLINEVGRTGYDLYYAPSAQVAEYLLRYAHQSADLRPDEVALLAGLDRRDIEIILAIKDSDSAA